MIVSVVFVSKQFEVLFSKIELLKMLFISSLNLYIAHYQNEMIYFEIYTKELFPFDCILVTLLFILCILWFFVFSAN